MPLDLTRIRGLCFDLDGTLSDSDDVLVSRLEQRLARLRPFLFGADPHRVARRVIMRIESPGNFIMAIPDRFGFDAPLAWLVERLNHLGPIRRRAPFLAIPGIRASLAALRERYPLALVSARDEDTSLAFLEAFELLEFFPVIATAQTCAHTKPYPDPILWAADRMGVAPGQCVMIGDTTVDVRAGRAAGAQTIAVLCGFGEQPELRRAGADLIIPSTALLPDILLEANK